MTATHVLYVAAGGALGAVARYLVFSGAAVLFGHGYPFGTLIVNIIGSFALGLFVEISALVWSPSPEVRVFVVVGLLGAFTTFSTFSLDVVTLLQRGQTASALIYVASSVVLSITAFWLGLVATRSVLT